ncbi:3-dehydroquinate synthase [Tumebacillus permanentifrigoris]|uniref:3-dehydroquinate synthase n=1 Tax=Tumebacillus permanentifrigoris TaxID=378543 RepID=A0A316D3U3_9BACL|nr:3-dehydroquinate synthase [Tumebacillus permanentifrigoris]PWK06616.1 3-dehydroquinate synthase [Tumebacillus permanentifrigoris]
MVRERVDVAGHPYEIVIGPAVLARTGTFLQELGVTCSSKHLIVTDTNVERTGHLEKVTSSLTELGYTYDVHVIPAGEESKSLARAGEAFEAAYRAGLDRRSVVLALGGGVVGDFAGFIAATYMRGVDFVQLPTTLLAHDSAVGGKVAVNLPHAKNMIGAFHQPLAVLYDTDALKTLPVRELRSGLAEAIKHGLIRDAELFAWIMERVEAILRVEDDVMSELLARSCRIKAEVVSADERENGVRAILNFGHTLGHAVESLMEYEYTHGESVAIGMVAAADLSVQLGLCAPELSSVVEQAVAKAGLPTRIPAQLSTEDLLAAMRQDKKATGGTLTFVLLTGIGRVDIVKQVPEDAVREVIARRKG